MLELSCVCLGPESNQRHGDFQSPALPTELPRRTAPDPWAPRGRLFYDRPGTNATVNGAGRRPAPYGRPAATAGTRSAADGADATRERWSDECSMPMPCEAISSAC